MPALDHLNPVEFYIAVGVLIAIGFALAPLIIPLIIGIISLPFVALAAIHEAIDGIDKKMLQTRKEAGQAAMNGIAKKQPQARKEAGQSAISHPDKNWNSNQMKSAPLND